MIAKNCRIFNFRYNSPGWECEPAAPGETTTSGVISFNGQPGVPCTFVSDGNPNGERSIICVPSLTGPPDAGTTVTTTNPSGQPGDPSVTGTVSDPTDPGSSTFVQLCERKQPTVTDPE